MGQRVIGLRFFGAQDVMAMVSAVLMESGFSPIVDVVRIVGCPEEVPECRHRRHLLSGGTQSQLRATHKVSINPQRGCG